MSSENVVFGVDWNTVDKKYNWLAVDKDGSVYAYVDKPSGHGHWVWNYLDEGHVQPYVADYKIASGEDWTTMIAERPKQDGEYRRKPQTVTITIPEDVAIAFTSLVLVSDAGKAVSVAIQEALNKRYD